MAYNRNAVVTVVTVNKPLHKPATNIEAKTYVPDKHSQMQ